MEFLELKKDDKVIYLRNFLYKLHNGQQVSKEGEELMINSNVKVQKNFFAKVEVKKEEVKAVEVKKTLDEMKKDELLKFADENKLDVDKRKGEDKIRDEIKSLLKK